MLSEPPPVDHRDRNEKESGYTQGHRGQLTLPKDISSRSLGSETRSKSKASILEHFREACCVSPKIPIDYLQIVESWLRWRNILAVIKLINLTSAIVAHKVWHEWN